MELTALVIYGLAALLTGGVRAVIQLRRTGSTGVRGIDSGAAPIEWVAAGIFALGLALGLAAPLAALADVVEPIAAIDSTALNLVGLVLAAAGLLLIFGAQLAMGDAWRIGVDPEERTDLVTGGPFALVRNPIYSAMIPTVAGLAMMVPSLLAIVAIAALVTGLELQVRFVEEPYLLRIHGGAYAGYASHVGRFIPGIGRLHNP